MKRIGLFFLTLAAAAGLASCNDSKYDGPTTSSVVTVRTLPGDYYFVMDNNRTIYPGDKTRVSTYVPEDGERAVIYLSLLETPAEGYDFNAAIYAVGRITSASVEVIGTKEELEELKDDPTVVLKGQLVGDWINLIVRYAATSTDPEKHKFRLVVNQTEESSDVRDDYLKLELYHDADGEVAGIYYDRYLSFNTNAIRDLLADKEGVVITFHDGMQDQKVEIERTAINAQSL
ncbi:MAG: NigD-like protein [Alistipes sp.]|nr:NigD-like protein [Alistipes sp.]